MSTTMGVGTASTLGVVAGVATAATAAADPAPTIVLPDGRTAVLLWSATTANGLAFSGPSSVDTDEAGNVYVADTGNDRIVKLDPSGAHVPTAALDDGSGALADPEGVTIAANPGGDPVKVVVADTGNNRIRRLSPAGVWSTDAVVVIAPEGVDSLGDVMLDIGDTGAKKQRTCFLGSCGSSYTSANFTPTGVSIGIDLLDHPDGFDPYFMHYGADRTGHRVVKFNDAGSVWKVYGGYGTAPGRMWQPEDVDAYQPTVIQQSILVTDTGNSRLQFFHGNSAAFQSAFGTRGSGPGQFLLPESSAVTRYGDIVVADTGNNRIQYYAATPGPPRSVQVAPGGPSALAVSWQPADDLGLRPPLSYTASTNGGANSCTVAAPATSCTITGLTPGVTVPVVVTATNVIGPGQASPPVNGTPSTAVGVHGTVFNTQGLLPGATVSLYRATGGVVATRTTAADGTFSFTGIPAGQYKVKIAKADHRTEWYDNVAVGASATVLDLQMGFFPDLGIRLNQTSETIRISGTITDNGPGPVSGATVRLYTADGYAGAQATTDSNGNYTLPPQIPLASYYVRASAPGHHTRWSTSSATFAGATAVGTWSGDHDVDIALPLVTAP